MPGMAKDAKSNDEKRIAKAQGSDLSRKDERNESVDVMNDQVMDDDSNGQSDLTSYTLCPDDFENISPVSISKFETSKSNVSGDRTRRASPTRRFWYG